MTHDEAAARAQVKASIWTPASPRNAEFYTTRPDAEMWSAKSQAIKKRRLKKGALTGMMPFLIVSAVLAPTRMAPSISKIVPSTMAQR